MNYKRLFNFKIYIMKKLKAFTMLEILIITIIVWVWLLSIVVAISKAKTVTNQIKQEVIATHLAKEWLEMVYQTRNSNLLQHPNYKNYCRLNINPTQTCDNLNHPDRLTDSSYIITGRILSWTNEELNISNGIDTWDKIFSLNLTWSKRIQDPNMEDNQTKYGKFFRTIEWKWLFLKNSTTTWWELISCSSWWISLCNSWNAKEFRFCSRVEYIWTNTGSVEICWILTNFFEN